MATLWRRWFGVWLARRVPPKRERTLNQRCIFIFPNWRGGFFLLLAFVLFIGGINYQNNLVMGFSFLLFSLFCVAIWHTYRNLSGLTLTVLNMQPAFAGSEGSVRLHLKAAREHAAISVYWLAKRPAQLSLNANEEADIALAVPLTKRGWNRPGRLHIESRFPLGLIRAWCLLDMDCACLAWPTPLPGGVCPASGGEEEAGRKRTASGSEDFAGLRDYVPGDSLQHIDWKAFARSNELQVRQFIDPVEGQRQLEWDKLEGMAVEQRLSRLCYWALQLEKRGQLWGLSIPGTQIPPDRGEAHLHDALSALACFGEVSP